MKVILDSDTNQYGPDKRIEPIIRKIRSKDLLEYNKSPKIIPIISKKFKIDEKNIIIEDGVLNLIVLVLSNFINKGDKVLIPEQGYHFYNNYLKMKQARIIYYPSRKIKGRFGYSCDEITKRILAHKPKLVLLIDPNIPLGYSMKTEDINKIIKTVSNSSIILLDQVHEGFRDNKDKDVTTLIKSHSNLMVFRSFSKFYASAAIRLGFALCGSSVKKIISFSINPKYLGVNCFSDSLGAYILTHEGYYKKIAKKIIKTRREVVDTINHSGFVKAYDTDNLFILVESEEKIITRLLDDLYKNNILVKKFMKDDGYNMVSGKERYLKVTIGTDKQMSKFLNVFNKSLKKSKNENSSYL